HVLRSTAPQSRAATRRADHLEVADGDAGLRPGGARESIPAEEPPQLALDAHPVRRKNADLVAGVCWFECNRGAAATETLEGGLFVVDQCDHDVAGIGALRLLE